MLPDFPVFTATSRQHTVFTVRTYHQVNCADPEKRDLSFDVIIVRMLAEAWYLIHYFKLSFGKMDSLEEKNRKIQRLLDIPIDAHKNTEANYFEEHR